MSFDDDLTQDISEQASVDKAAKDAAARELADNETFRIWMSHPNGRDLLYRIMFETCHMGQTFTAVDDQGRSDPLRTYLDLGERNIGAWLDGQLRKHPKLYMDMLTEQQTEREVRTDRIRKQNEKANDDES
jgi:hypothetical protein